MKALIDGDIFQWEFGSATDDEFKPLAWPLVQARIQGRINGIMEATGADSYQIYITSDDKSNFRYGIASIRPYKGHRAVEKPHWYHHIRNFLVDHRGAQEVSGQEADDALSITQWEDYITSFHIVGGKEENKDFVDPRLCETVICSRDKDLDMVPGWHYSWACGKQKEKELWWQDEISGLRAFYRQCILGDSVDNILGLYGVGPNSRFLEKLENYDNNLDLYHYVLGLYRKRFGSYAEQFLLENARLLWMRKEEGELWNPPKKT